MNERKAIVVPLDGSAFAEWAMPVAAALALRDGVPLLVVGVHEADAVSSVLPFDESIERDARAAELEYLSSVAARWFEQGVRVRAELLEGPVARTLASYAADVDATAIVMTTHGRSGLSRVWLGSVAEAVVRESGVPVLLVRPAEQAEPPREARFAPERVLVPVDGSALSERVFGPAFALCGAGARYTLLRVLDLDASPAARLPDPMRAADFVARERTAAEQALAEAAARLENLGATVETVVAEGGPAGATILAKADELGADLIALATRGRGGWARLALGSVADKVIRGARVPVLAYRPAAEPASDEAAARPAGAALRGEPAPEDG